MFSEKRTYPWVPLNADGTANSRGLLKTASARFFNFSDAPHAPKKAFLRLIASQVFVDTRFQIGPVTSMTCHAVDALDGVDAKSRDFTGVIRRLALTAAPVALRRVAGSVLNA
jgi:hypothetical protein